VEALSSYSLPVDRKVCCGDSSNYEHGFSFEVSRFMSSKVQLFSSAFEWEEMARGRCGNGSRLRERMPNKHQVWVCYTSTYLIGAMYR
jgi:hypothetical protein